jgi:hypothetical protein
MAINYEGPSVSITTPSGTDGSPYIYYFDSLEKSPVIDWTYSDPEGNELSHAQIQVLKAGEVVWDSGGVKLPADGETALMGSGLSYLLTLTQAELPSHDVLPFNTLYSVQMRAMDKTEDPTWQKWGDWSSPQSFKVALNDSASFVTVKMSAAADDQNGKIVLSWTDDADEFGTLSKYEVYRSTQRNSGFELVSTQTSQTYEDLSTAASTEYYYKIKVIMTDGSSAFSPMSYGIVYHELWTIGAFKFAPSTFSKKRQRAQSKRATLRSSKRLIQDKGFREEEMSLEIDLLDDHVSTGEQKYDALMTELNKTEVLTMSDPFGRSWNFSPGDFEDEQLLTGKLEYRVKLSVSEVSG